MSYVVYADGELVFKPTASKEQVTKFLSELADLGWQQKDLELGEVEPKEVCQIGFTANFYEDELLSILRKNTDLLKVGDIYCTGEDDEMWAYGYMPEDRRWHLKKAVITYEDAGEI